MFRLKMGFTKVLAAAATRGTPLAAILLNKPPPHPIPFQPASAALFSLAKTERHAPNPCGWARAAGAECACSAAQTQARALCVLPATAPPGGARAPGWPLAAGRRPLGRVLAPLAPGSGAAAWAPASCSRAGRAAPVVAPFGALAEPRCLCQLPGRGPRAVR